MMQKFHNDEDDEGTDETAVQLLLSADLTLLLRVCRAMVLDTGDGEYVGHAMEALRIPEKLV